MDLTLVPFGLLKSENKLVDVYQVPSGKRCGCECPSCHAPLIARRGKKYIWHFAHDSKSERVSRLEKCTYSFYVSTRMMALQLMCTRLSITLPAYTITQSEYIPKLQQHALITETVTASRQVILDNALPGARIAGHKLDVLGYVNEYPLAIAFSHPGKVNHWQHDNLEDEKAGVLEISLHALKDRFRKADTLDKAYTGVLEDFLCNDTASKKWIYHPRENQSKQLANTKLRGKVGRLAKQAVIRTKPERKTRPRIDDAIFKGLMDIKMPVSDNVKYDFVCRLCNSTWSGIGSKDATCRQCGTSLLVSRSKVTD